jgi:hypothetical protein
MGISEASASDQLSEILTHDQNLNAEFIDVVEKIHMNVLLHGISILTLRNYRFVSVSYFCGYVNYLVQRIILLGWLY